MVQWWREIRPSHELVGAVVIHPTTGEIIRTLTINPNRRYHGTGKPPADPKDHENHEPEPMTKVRALPMSRDITMERTTGFEPATLTLAR